MRKYLYIASASLLMLASCSEEEIFTNVENQNVITASFENGNNSRIAVGDDNMLRWSAGDQFVVLSETSSGCYTLSGEGGNSTGTFTGTLPSGTIKGAAYPFVNETLIPTLSGNTLTMTMPSEITFEEGICDAPMWAAMTSGDINSISFKHLVSMLKVDLSGIPATAGQLIVDASTPIAGKFTADITKSGDELILTANTDAANSITVKFDASSSNTQRLFLIPIPVGTYTNFTLSYANADGSEKTFLKSWSNLTFSRATPNKATIAIGDIDADLNQNVEVINGDTYVIKNVAGLLWFAEQVNSENDFAGKTVKLGGDINLNNEEWTPIGNGQRSGSGVTGNSFKGVFDGGNFTISGLKISTGNEDDAIGLFGVVDGGVIKNIKIDNVNITASGNALAGGAVGFLTGGGKVQQVEVSGSITAKKGVGGIVGRATISAEISECKNSATINATSGNAGGIVGAAYYTSEGNTYIGETAALMIKNCENSGNVTTSNGGYTGGIVGLSSASVVYCTNKGAVTGNSTSIGGVVGEQKEAGEVLGCVNNGSVTNQTAAYGTGGIVGWLRYPASETGSGKAYEVQNVIEVKNNNNTGTVVGGNDAGGIVGTVYNYAVVISNENSASSLSAKTFAAGIVGNVQFDSANDMLDQTAYMVQVTGNVSTTNLDNMTVEGTCKSLYVYDNSQGSHTNIAGNTGGRIVVTSTEEAQSALDQAVEGTTIYLSANVNYGILTIRPTANSNTTYKCFNHSENVYTNVDDFKTHMEESGYHATPYYTTMLKDVTIVGAEGAAIEGFTASSGHFYGEVKDYVLDKEYTSGSAYYYILNISNLTFQNVSFTGKVDINTSQAESVYDGVNFEGCTFTTGGTESTNGAAIRYYNEANNGNVKNIKVVDCEFENCYQGVYVHHVNGVTVTGSTFTTTGHNAIALQSSSGSVALKTVVITGNQFKNIGDRIIRFNDVAADSNITIQNNIATNSGDENKEVMKATFIAADVVTDIKNNDWGESSVVANEELKDKE